jgi:hypothetical protein
LSLQLCLSDFELLSLPLSLLPEPFLLCVNPTDAPCLLPLHLQLCVHLSLLLIVAIAVPSILQPRACAVV